MASPDAKSQNDSKTESSRLCRLARNNFSDISISDFFQTYQKTQRPAIRQPLLNALRHSFSTNLRNRLLDPVPSELYRSRGEPFSCDALHRQEGRTGRSADRAQPSPPIFLLLMRALRRRRNGARSAYRRLSEFRRAINARGRRRAFLFQSAPGFDVRLSLRLRPIVLPDPALFRLPKFPADRHRSFGDNND